MKKSYIFFIQIKKYFYILSAIILFVLLNSCNCGMDQNPLAEYASISLTRLRFAEPILKNNHVILDYYNPGNITNNSATFEIRELEFPITYNWLILISPSGSSPVINTSTPYQATVEINTNGLYVIMLYVRDNEGNDKTEYAYISTTSTLKYVRADASGANDGSNWTNAYTYLPVSLERGYTYFIADGTYTSHIFNDTENETMPIIIKKAIPSDHGTDTGWVDTFGDGQAIFPNWTVNRSYYIFDGQVGGGPSSWETGYAGPDYGIKIKYPYSGTSQYVILLHGYPWGKNSPSNLEFKHIDFEHMGVSADEGGRIFQFYSPDSLNDGFKNIIISNCYLHDCSAMMISTVYVTNMLVEYCYFARNNSTEEFHGEAWQDHGSINVIIRYNKFEDITGTAFIALKKNYGHNHVNWAIHSNLFMYTSGFSAGVGMGVLCDNGMPEYPASLSRNILFYNNTTYNVVGWNCGVYLYRSDGTSYAYNNLYLFNSAKVNYIGVIHDYCYYYGNTVYVDYPPLSEHDFFSGTSNPCGNLTPPIYNFELTTSAGPGLTLQWPYNKDMNGNERGSDSTWDIGAYEF